jgi:hypothetical protein
MGMRRIILSSVACTPVIGFSTLHHKRYDYKKEGTEQKIYILIFSKTFVWNIQRDIMINVPSFLREVPLFLSDFNETWIISIEFRNKVKY